MEYPSSYQTFGNQYYEKTKQRKQPPKLQHHQTESAKVRNRVWFRTGPNSKSTNQERPQNISSFRVICGEGHSHKGCPNREKSNLNVLIVKDHMLPITKGVQPTKDRCSDNMWWTTKKAMPQF